MIRFNLTCDQNHQFESWFADNVACDKLLAAGMVDCLTCGSSDVKKSLMAPAVAAKGHVTAPEAPLEKIKREVEANSDYVGMSFAQEARDMHDGLIPDRPIYGEAKPDEAIKLIKDGVPVLPLPFVPTKKAN